MHSIQFPVLSLNVCMPIPKPFRLPVIFAGLSVLFIIAFICLGILSKPKLHLIELYWYKEGVNHYWHIPKRQYLTVTFTGDTCTDQIKLKFGQIYIRELLNNKDTIHGIDFHFSDHSRFSTFVEVLDICTIEQATTYAASDSGYKVYYIYLPNSHIDSTASIGFL